MSAVTLAQAKAHLNTASTVNDAELQDAIDSAESMIAGLGVDVVQTSYSQTLYDQNAMTIQVDHYPVVSITSASYQYFTGGGSTALTPASDLLFDPLTGIVRRSTLFPMLGNITITYVAGYATLPADLKRAVLELVRHLWETQRGQSQAVPGYDATGQPSGTAYAFPNRVMEILRPYLPERVA